LTAAVAASAWDFERSETRLFQATSCGAPRFGQGKAAVRRFTFFFA